MVAGSSVYQSALAGGDVSCRDDDSAASARLHPGATVTATAAATAAWLTVRALGNTCRQCDPRRSMQTGRAETTETIGGLGPPDPGRSCLSKRSDGFARKSCGCGDQQWDQGSARTRLGRAAQRGQDTVPHRRASHVCCWRRRGPRPAAPTIRLSAPARMGPSAPARFGGPCLGASVPHCKPGRAFRGGSCLS